MSFKSENQILLKKILFRANYRGTKELDLLFGNFIKNYLEEFDLDELKEVEKLGEWSEIALYGLFTKNIGALKLSKSMRSKISRYISGIQNSLY
jgi:antitoxin CptB